MLLVIVVMVGSIFIVTRRPVVVIVPSGGGTVQPADSGGAAAHLAGDVGAAAATAPEAPLPEVTVTRVPSAPAVDNPLDPQWDQIAAVEIPLTPQQVAEPMSTESTVPNVRVQAVHDGQRYVWRLSWLQEQPSASSDFAQFTDAAAIQFPLADGAPYTMGGPGMPVSILYWKAIWQKDFDEGFQDLAGAHPNAYNDFYWFAPETGNYSADKLLDGDPAAQQWLIAASAGNPMADFKRKCPFEELTAHGFGTTTHVPDGQGQARGKWDNGRWHVVFERASQPDDKLMARFAQNPQQQMIAFAVWNGTAQDRGGKKNISNWIPMKINP
jgi:hypothetical protein